VNWVVALRQQLIFVSDHFEANHFWSLAVEEQFYLLWPAVVFALSQRWLIRSCLVVIASSFLLRALVLPSALTMQVVRADGLVLGGCLAASIRAPRPAVLLKAFAPKVLAACALILTAIFFARHGLLQDDPWMRGAGLAIAQIGCGASVIAVLGVSPAGRVHRLLCAQPLAALARYSYAIYIFHWAFAPWFRRLADAILAPPWTRISIFDQVLHAIFFGLLSVGMAVVSYRLLERPFLHLKDRLAPQGQGPLTPPAPPAPQAPQAPNVRPAI
jgi:peptidoglycan/LPS O-acetylase OafA/YrhL